MTLSGTEWIIAIVVGLILFYWFTKKSPEEASKIQKSWYDFKLNSKKLKKEYIEKEQELDEIKTNIKKEFETEIKETKEK